MDPFRYLLRARYPECDAQGIVFNARYGDWADLATTELVRAIDPSLLQGFDYRLRQQSTEWLAPARFDDVVVALVRVERVGGTSFQVDTEFLRHADDLPLARTSTTYVLVDAEGRKRAVPDALRALLLHGAPGRVTDHAAVGGGRVVHVYAWSRRRTLPWKNGGGVTHELYDLDGLRFSIAEVARPGPFSAFPGVDRTIVLLEGERCVLQRGELDVTLRPGVPFAFHGEDAWACVSVQGPDEGRPALDFNVMLRREAGHASVWRVAPGLVDAHWLLALEPGTVAGVRVERHDLLLVNGPVPLTMPSLAVRLAG
jgi:acyl-CoA thioester hydrolase